MTYLNKNQSVKSRKDEQAKKDKLAADIRIANVFKQHFEIRGKL